MLNRRRFFTYILLALIAGIGFASFATKITYPCPPLPDDPTSQCVLYDKAVLHPIDLALNMQGSLVRFLLNLLVGFAIILALQIACNRVWLWAKKLRH